MTGINMVTILSAAVIAEAVILAGVVTLVARLRSRLEKVGAVSTAAVDQMSALVQEAQELSDILAEQLAEQVRLYESQAARAAVAAPVAAAPEAAAKAATSARTRKKAAATEDKPAEKPARARKTAQAAAPAEDVADLTAARRTGMDPLGVALQRSLARQRALSA